MSDLTILPKHQYTEPMIRLGHVSVVNNALHVILADTRLCVSPPSPRFPTPRAS